MFEKKTQDIIAKRRQAFERMVERLPTDDLSPTIPHGLDETLDEKTRSLPEELRPNVKRMVRKVLGLQENTIDDEIGQGFVEMVCGAAVASLQPGAEIATVVEIAHRPEFGKNGQWLVSKESLKDELKGLFGQQFDREIIQFVTNLIDSINLETSDLTYAQARLIKATVATRMILENNLAGESKDEIFWLNQARLASERIKEPLQGQSAGKARMARMGRISLDLQGFYGEDAARLGSSVAIVMDGIGGATNMKSMQLMAGLLNKVGEAEAGFGGFIPSVKESQQVYTTILMQADTAISAEQNEKPCAVAMMMVCRDPKGKAVVMCLSAGDVEGWKVGKANNYTQLTPVDNLATSHIVGPIRANETETEYLRRAEEVQAILANMPVGIANNLETAGSLAALIFNDPEKGTIIRRLQALAQTQNLQLRPEFLALDLQSLLPHLVSGIDNYLGRGECRIHRIATRLKEGDRLILATDGITDSLTRNERIFDSQTAPEIVTQSQTEGSKRPKIDDRAAVVFSSKIRTDLCI